jgi:hypothetical protein
MPLPILGLAVIGTAVVAAKKAEKDKRLAIAKAIVAQKKKKKKGGLKNLGKRLLKGVLSGGIGAI